MNNTLIEEKRKKREKAFIEKAMEIQHGKYSYDHFVFVNTHTKGLITCPIHGDFLQTPKNHLQGQGCPYHYLNTSKSEDEIADFIKEGGFTVTRNDRSILENRHELDIYIPDRQLAIEFDGVFWHNEMNKPVNYHLNKTEECNKKGIKLIHIFEDEWLDKPNIWKSMLNNLLGLNENRIFARKCEIKEVSMEDSKTFL